MKGLTFTIDPAARWDARESGPLAPLNLLPLFWTPRTNRQPERPARSLAGTCPRHVHSPVMRNLLQARLACATHAIRRTNHSSYEGYSISTMQNGDGKWVAALGRRDDDLMASGRAKHAVFETGPEVAEVIAIADAQIAIDDRLAALLTARVPNLPIVKTCGQFGEPSQPLRTIWFEIENGS